MFTKCKNLGIKIWVRTNGFEEKSAVRFDLMKREKSEACGSQSSRKNRLIFR